MSDKCHCSEWTPCQSALSQLFRTHHRLHRVLQTRVDQHGVTLAQFELMMRLQEAPGLTQQEVAERLDVTKGNIVGLIDRLAERGFVERRADADDRRLNCLFLTESGERVCQESCSDHANTCERILDTLSESEKEQLIALLSRIEQSL